MQKAVKEGANNVFLLKGLSPKDVPGLTTFGYMNPKWSDLKLNHTWQESVLVSAWILKADMSRTKICGIF